VKTFYSKQAWWCASVISTTREVRQENLQFEDSGAKAVRPYLRNKIKTKGLLAGMAQVVECLPSSIESKIQSPEKKEKENLLSL
jgi:hypothetical protein